MYTFLYFQNKTMNQILMLWNMYTMNEIVYKKYFLKPKLL